MPREHRTITLPADQRARAIASIRRYFADHMDEPIGDLKAALLLDYMLEEHGPVIYNQAIAEARQYLDERLADLSAICHVPERSGAAGTRRR